MTNFRMFLKSLLGLYVIFSGEHFGFSLMTARQPQSPDVSISLPLSGKRSLVVRWLVNHGNLVGNISEIQVGRTENHIIIHSENVSISSADEHTWSWTSDLPLECVDHSVRIRHFYKQSVVSHWSNWTTHPGVKAHGEVMIFPFQEALREGTSAVVCCVCPPGENITEMVVDNRSRPRIGIGAGVQAVTVDDLTITEPDNPHFGSCYPLNLSCRDTAGHSRDIINYITTPPPKPRNISCETSDTITVSCIWDLGRKQKELFCNSQTQTLHIENADQAPVVCQRSSCSFPAIRRLEEYRIRVVVKNQVGEEAESHSFNISDRVLPVVRWDAAEPGFTNATVSWTVEGNLTQGSVLCQVHAAPRGTAELSCRSADGRCRARLEHLVPNTRYSTRARCSVNGRFWGGWTPPSSFTTLPLVSVNLWRTIKQRSDPPSRLVTLVWTLEVPGSATEVEIQGYVVQWWQRGQNRTERRERRNQTEVSMGPEQQHFTVEAVVRGGRSVPAHITVPEAEDGEKPPAEKKLSSSTAGGFNLSWAQQVDTTCGYTVEWCIQGHTAPCTLRWVKIPERNNTLLLPAGNFRAGCRYTFNIYGCTGSGDRLLETQTGYSQELSDESLQAPRVVQPIQRTSSSVTLTWSYDEDDPEHPAFITGYLVRVEDTLPGHSANVFNVSVADPHSKSAVMAGLQENHEYVFHLSALTKNGPGRAVGVTVRTTTNYSAHLAKTLTPLFLLLGCVVLLWPRRKMLKNGLREIFIYPAGMNIKVSELDAFLNKAEVIVPSHRPEECVSCDIEILHPSPPLEAATSLGDPDPLSKPPSPGRRSLASLSSAFFHDDYCPQSALWPHDQHTGLMNKSYFCSVAEETTGSQQITSKIQLSLEPEGPQESCSVIYGYIAKENL
ncbi:oncostatin-M-specific receptor subunit beta isoform X2 [Betta splendens]|uniref:Oncostatin-M-specific receptor subunit beta isoform X2 n=1 Tax=Betta splendens TaxID=158456 RepID=A0A6P7NJD2_BETSP|nr:oncostatin-M-specific receptor subunit beta isoform X2 [Betta splendens]